MVSAKSTFRFIEPVVVPAAVALAWYVVTGNDLVSRLFLPAPQDVVRSLIDLASDGVLYPTVGATLWRMMAGWCVASLLGIGLGALIGLNPKMDSVLSPTLEFMRPLPASAVIPVFVMTLGLTDRMIIAVIAFGSLWPVLLNTISGMRAVDRRLREVASALEFTSGKFLIKFALPSALPDIVAGLRLGLSLALILCVVAEMITLSGGIGTQILLASRNFRSADLFSGVVIIGVIGFLANGTILLLERRALAWRT